MVDFLLVHDAGHGSWCWGRVWGHLTAPVEHPPRLYSRARVGNVVAIDLPRLPTRTRGRASELALDEYVAAVTSEVRSRGLHDLIMAGHGAAAPVLLRAASQLDEPPRRIVLFAGIIPGDGKTVMDILPRRNRLGLKMLARLNGMARRETRLPKAVTTNIYCNGMDPSEVIQIIGRFSPLPLQLFRARVNLKDLTPNCPVTYVPLWRDNLVPFDLQRRMAGRLDGVELAPVLDSCHEVMIERPRQVSDILLRYA